MSNSNFFKRLFGNRDSNTTDTFVKATGGGWGDTPNIVPADGGSQKDYVESQLELAKQQAASVAVGESFTYRLTDIPVGISGPHEIMFGMMMRSHEYGLMSGPMIDEKIEFTRIS